MNRMFDTHAHYDDERFDEDRYELLDTMKDNDIRYIMNVATNLKTSKFSIELAKKYDYIYASCGIHPHDAKKEKENLEEIKELFDTSDKIKAVGEIGLDYYYDFSPKEIQKEIFRKQLSFAKEMNLPVIIHNREAHQDTLEIVKEFKGVRGVIHCFSGSKEMAKIILDLGFYISFGGTLTFKNAKKPLEVLRNTPDDRILAETDSPYLTPVPLRGKRNDSRYVEYVIKKIAKIKNITFDKAADLTCQNGKELFNIR